MLAGLRRLLNVSVARDMKINELLLIIAVAILWLAKRFWC